MFVGRRWSSSSSSASNYAWSEESDDTLQDFLTKFKPSMFQDDQTKPRIYVRRSESLKENSGVVESKEEAAKLLKEVTEKVVDIKNDDSIPNLSNKKKGYEGKKVVREQVQAEATDKLKEIAIKHGYVSGKWLLYARTDRVDMIWSSIASSLLSGPLYSTSAYQASVSTTLWDDRHLISVYIPDVYDKASVTEVMRVLLRNHGANLSGVKSNFYTTIGIGNKHPSGIPSTIWKNTAIMSEEESKELKDAYYSELKQNKLAQVDEQQPPQTGRLPRKSPVYDNPADSYSPIPMDATTSTKGKGELRPEEEIDPFASFFR